MDSHSIVLPDEAWPTMAKFRRSAGAYCFMIQERGACNAASKGNGEGLGNTKRPEGTVVWSLTNGLSCAAGYTGCPGGREGKFAGSQMKPNC